MNIACYRNKKKQQIEVLEAFAESCGGHIYESVDGLKEADINVFIGFQDNCDVMLMECRKRQLNYLFIDHAYFNRGYDKSNYRITLNALNQSFLTDKPIDPTRVQKVKLYPWRTDGSHIILIPPSETMKRVLELDGWTERTIFELQKYTTRPIIVKHKFEARPLQNYLVSAHALVAHNSMAAVEAACFGVPVFVDPSSPAVPVGRTDFSKIEQPIYPDREQWIASLSMGQFNMAEIRSGYALQTLLK